MASSSKRFAPRWRRWALYVVVGVVVLIALLFVALRTSFAREQLRVQVNAALAELFQGRLQLERIGRVSLGGVDGVDARVFDADGKQVARVQGLAVDASLLGLGWQLLTNSDQPQLVLARVQVAHADVTLRDDEELGVSIARAFLPRTPGEEPANAPPSGPHLRLERIELGHVWAHGQLGSSPVLDAELRRLEATLSQSPDDGFSLTVKRAELVTRGLPGGAQPSGQLTGKIVAPADAAQPLRLEGSLKGRAAGSPLELEASWVGDDLRATLDLRELPAAFVNEKVSGLRLEGSVVLHAEVAGALPVLDFAASVDGAAAHVDARGYAAVAQGLEAVATVVASRVDAAGIFGDAPQSDLYLRVDACLFEEDDNELRFAQRVELEPGQVAGNATPPLWVNGHGRLNTDGALSGSGQLAVHDAGLTVQGLYRVALPSGAGGSVGADLRAELDDPTRLRDLGLEVGGNAELSGELKLQSRSLVGRASLRLRHVAHAVVQARNVELQARASGTLDQPKLHAGVTMDVLSGRAHADLDYTAGQQELSFFLANIDLLRFANIVGTKLPLQQATLGAKGRITRQATAAHYALNADAQVDLGKVGSTQLTAVELQLPTAVPPRSQWGNLKGELVVRGNLHLEELSPLLTRASLPIERTTGNVRFELASKHRPGDAEGVDLSVTVDSSGLRVIQQRQPPKSIETTAAARASQPLALEGIDVHLAAHVRPRTGETYGTLILRDAGGTLADIEAATQLPDGWPASFAGLASLTSLPLKARVEVPKRRLGSLPPLVRPPGLRGRVGLEASFDGSVNAPQIVAKISAESLRSDGKREPVNLEAQVRYTPERGDCDVHAKLTNFTSPAARFKAIWQGDLRRVGLLASGESGLSGSADAELTDFPLDLVPAIADRQVQGRLSGKLSVKDWGHAAQLDATFSSKTLSIGKMPILELLVSAKTNEKQILADLAIKVRGGAANASLASSMRWGQRPVPELTRDGTIKLETQAFDLAALSPLLAGSVSEIGGVLDAKTQLVVTPQTTELTGSAKLAKGVLQLPALGQRFSEISARVTVDGKKLRVEDVSARGLTGRVTANASASLDGFALRAAEAHVKIGKNESLPLTLEGADLGDVWGNLDATFESPATGERKLNIDVPVLHLVMPDTSTYGLQSLDVPEEIRVGVRRADGSFIPLPVQPLGQGDETAGAEAPSAPLRIRVRLGKDVTVERGDTAQVQLDGELAILSGAETSVNGRIEIRGGKLDVSGKTFDIERGVVTFQGDDPGNPTITATARWDAPEYTVYADYLGDVKTGRIKLRSEPPLTPSEIANLLLFGSPEGSSSGSSDPNTAALAVGLAGDTAAKGLNQALDDFTKLDVSARIDTTTGSARPELVFQVSPRVSARVTRAIGAPSAGQAADRTFLTLELRLRRAWALSAVFGDHGGSALDLIWRRRY
ncbi:MAG TPA: translocation/assembly module TamB domain-containing protein [Polyangiaceae bacterium]|nr:translocation/assembly module TamB domain-containing protein [Polyangiaceae bacterium]